MGSLLREAYKGVSASGEQASTGHAARVGLQGEEAVMEAQLQNPAGELYVHRIDELREEIRHAMVALSGNRLEALEESLWRQEVLCTGLKHLLGTVQEAAPGTPLDARLQASLAALHHLNQSYAELLRQAQASNHLLHALCMHYGLPLGERNALLANRCSLEA